MSHPATVPAHRAVGAEFRLTASEMKILADRRLALTNMGERTGVDTRADNPYVSFGAGIGWSTLTQEPFEVFVELLPDGEHGI